MVLVWYWYCWVLKNQPIPIQSQLLVLYFNTIQYILFICGIGVWPKLLQLFPVLWIMKLCDVMRACLFTNSLSKENLIAKMNNKFCIVLKYNTKSWDYIGIGWFFKTQQYQYQTNTNKNIKLKRHFRLHSALFKILIAQKHNKQQCTSL